MDKAQELLYAVVGAGDFAVEKVRGARKLADRKTSQKMYKDFVKRGRTVTKKVTSTGPAKKAAARTKSARSQVRSTAASVTGAVRRTESAETPPATQAEAV